MKRFSFFAFIFILLLAGCNTNSSNENSTDEDLFIFTSIYPIQYVAEQITGDDATIQSVYPPGVDAHTYEPTSKEITNLANGDAFIYLGSGMEGFAESAADALESQDVLFVEIGEHDDLFIEGDHHEHDEGDEHGHAHDEDDHDHGDLDPHIWLDPLRMIEMGEIITNKLIELKPEDEENFTENFAILKENMTELDQAFKETLQSKENKQIIVTHAAYGYWEDRYGIEQIPISGLSSSDEPSQKELADIAKQAKEQDLQYVIFEQTGSNQVATIIQEHIDAKKLSIHNLEVLTEEDIENKEDYLSLMKKNLEVLDQATK